MDGILSEARSLDFAGVSARLLDFLADLESGWQLVFGAGVCLLLLWHVVRDRLAATATQRALRRQDRRLAREGVAAWQRPYRLLASRDGWDVLPDGFLMELAARLIDRDRVIDFIALAEAFEPGDWRQIARLARGEPETAMRRLSAFLTDVAAGLPARETAALLGHAQRIDPENHWALIDLATEHYTAKRYAEALPLLEQAIALGEGALARLPRDRDARGRTLSARAPRLTLEKMQAILKVAREMSEDCARRVRGRRQPA
jgi:tetratricopeptide (TPR) repeat protein